MRVEPFSPGKGKSFPYRALFRWVMIAAIFFFLGRMVWENWAQVKEASFAFHPFRLVLSILFFAFCYLVQFWAWYLITLKLGIALPFSETLESWFYSQLGKYLPGKIWLLLGRFYFYESKGKSKKMISLALYLETLTLLMAAGLLSVAGFLFLKDGNPLAEGLPHAWMILVLIVAFLSLHPRLLEKILNRVLLLLRREPITLSLSYGDVLTIVFICILVWMVGGLGFYLFVVSIFPVPGKYFLFSIGALAFSSILGLIAIFAPGGLGVLEGTLAYLLSWIMPGGVAIIISILTRLWMTFIEMGLIGVIYLSSRWRKGLRQNEEISV